MDARSEILARIAQAAAPAQEAGRVPAAPSLRDRPAIVEQFAEYAAEYKAAVHHCTPEEVRVTVEKIVGGQRTLIPEGLPEDWTPQGATTDHGLLTNDLVAFQAVVTACSVGIAETGTIVLDHGPGQGRRAITLVPDHHVVILPQHLVVDSVPEAVAVLADSVRLGRSLTWISGPSATSDIELSRVEGVHGPRKLDIVLVADRSEERL